MDYCPKCGARSDQSHYVGYGCTVAETIGTSAWRPIETYPGDNSDVLLTDGREIEIEMGRSGVTNPADLKHTRFYSTHGEYEALNAQFPMYWMPLPEFPKAK
jgi:hypothetical protein